MATGFNLEAILAKFPNLLKPHEKALPELQRNELLKQRVQLLVQEQAAKRNNAAKLQAQTKAAQAAAAAAAAQTGASGVVRPPNPQMAAPNQSPRVGMQQPQMNGQVQMNPNMLADQMRLQQQQQQQQQQQAQHAQQQQQQQQFQNLLANQQRLQSVQQQQQQQQQAGGAWPPPTPAQGATPLTNPVTAIATPSPQAGQQSPATNPGILGQSPVAARMQAVPSSGAGPSMPNTGTPGGPAAPSTPQVSASALFNDPAKLIANMPELLKMRQAGQMGPELQKGFDSLLATPEVQKYLQQMQARQAQNLRQNLANTANASSQPTAVLAAQQIAHLQQQQQQQRQAAFARIQQQQHQIAAAAGLTPEAIAQLTPQQLAQITQTHGQQAQAQALLQQQQMQQLQQQQMQQQLLQNNPQLLLRQNLQARPPGLQQVQLQNAQGNVLQGFQNPQAAQAAVQAAQAQLMQQQQQGQVQGMQQLTPQQAQQLAHAAAIAAAGQNNNFASPRPPVQPQGAPASLAEIRARLAALSEQDRERAFEKTPKLRAIYYSGLAGLPLQTHQLAMHQAAQQSQQAAHQAQLQAQLQQQTQQQTQGPQVQQQPTPQLQHQQPAKLPQQQMPPQATAAPLQQPPQQEQQQQQPQPQQPQQLQQQQPQQQPPTPQMQQQPTPQQQQPTPQAGTPQQVGTPQQPSTPQLAQPQPMPGPNGIPMQPTASMQARPHVGFPVLNNNMQMPPNKRPSIGSPHIGQPMQTGSPVAHSPQVRPSINIQAAAAMATGGQPTPGGTNRFFQQGIPIASPAPGQSPIRPPGLAFPPGQQVTPALILSDLDKKNMMPQAQPVSRGPTNEIIGGALDRSASLLARAQFIPQAADDAALRERLFEPYDVPGRQSHRATLLEGMSTVPVLTGVLTEKLPNELRTLVEGDTEEKPDVKSKKHDLEGSGMPGQKKQKVQEFAETIDKTLQIGPPVENLLLSLADEYVDQVAQTSCLLAKHRRSATIDRKDVQFAYESLYSRSLPGFSSDAIRLDQARSSRRAPVSQQRAAKLKLVNDAKMTWRREKEEAARAAEAAVIAAQAQAALGTVVPGTEPTTAGPTVPGTAAATAPGTAPGTVPATATGTALPTPIAGSSVTATPAPNALPLPDTPAVVVSAPPPVVPAVVV